MPYIDNSLILPGDKNTDISSIVINGDMFIANQSRFTIAANSSASVIIDINSFKVKLAILLIKTNATVTTVSLYRNPVVTSRGVPLTVNNRNDESFKQLSCDLFDLTSVISASGDLLFSDIVSGPSVKGNDVEATSGLTLLPFIFKRDTTYNMQIDNDDNSTSDYTITLALADNQ